MNPIIAWAAGTISVTPDTNLSNGQVVSVSGSGFADGSPGSILECNSDPSQPTIDFFGNPVAVSCSSPLSEIVTTSNSGNLAATPFTIVTGTVGPPTTGTDSSGGQASTDAAAYPCPPTQAQVDMGYTCNLSFGDQAGDIAVQNLTFTIPYTGYQPPSSGGSGSGSSNNPGSSQGSTGTSTKKSTSTSTKSTTPSTTPTTTSTPVSTTQSSTKPQSSSVSYAIPATTLTVKVDNSDNKPIYDAKVTLDNATSLTTNKNGLAIFQNVSVGTLTISVSDPGKKPAEMKLTLSSTKAKLVSIKLANKPLTLYYILAGVIIVLIGAAYLFVWKWSSRSRDTSSPLVAGGAVGQVSGSTPSQPTIGTVDQGQETIGTTIFGEKKL